MADVLTEHQEPTSYLTYPGDVRGGVRPIMGPTLEGRYVQAMEASYDPETDTTRVGVVKLEPTR